MKKSLIIIISILLPGVCSFSQSERIHPPKEFLHSSEQKRSFQSHIPVFNTITWKKVLEQDILGIGKYTLLHFDNAHYDLSNHFFPIYSERIQIPSGASNADVKIIDEVFQPLSDSEKTAINSYDFKQKNFITNNVAPSVTIGLHKKNPYAYVQFIPIRKNIATGNYEKLVSFSLQVTPVENPNRINQATKTYASNSVLASGKWYKVSVAKDGIYKMDYTFMKNLGLVADSTHLKHEDIRVYGNGGGQLPYANAGFRHDDLQENAIYVIDKDTNGNFDSTDYVLFYGQSQHRWKYNDTDKKFHHNLNIYSDSTCYFITADLGPGKRVALQNSSTNAPTHTVSSFNDYEFYEKEAVNLLKSGRQWMGETFDILGTPSSPYSFTFNFPNIETSSRVHARVEVGARADTLAPAANFSWSVGSVFSSFNVARVFTSDIYGIYYKVAADTVSFIPSSGSVLLNILKTTLSPSIGWLNHIEINARRLLKMDGDQMVFRDINSVGASNVSQFVISNATAALNVWDVTDPINVKLQHGNFSGTTFDFRVPTDSLKEFVAFNGQSFLTPEKEGEVENQDLHGMAQSDFIIVTHPLFLKQADALADLHRTQDTMTVSVATTEQVYNEFSSGSQDVSAIRDFVRMFYNRAGADPTQEPKYLLLFGRGSYDLRSKSNNTNFIPAYESLNSIDPMRSYPSDDFYGMLDTSEGAWDVTPDVLDIGIGRLPVKSLSEADIVLNKIIKYTSVPGTIETGNSCSTDACYGLGDWMNIVTFVADDGDGGLHLGQADGIANQIDVNYNRLNIDKIYLDAYTQVSVPGGERYPDATAAFMRRMDRGSLIVNYTGHGGPVGLTHERFLENYHINTWKNKCRLPFFFTATCDFSPWDDPGRISSGELTLLNPEGGGIGLMTTTRVVSTGPNGALNGYFYEYVFKLLPDGKKPRFGDLCMLTKNRMSPSLPATEHRGFTLLGDPALALRYPKHTIVTTEINGEVVNPLQPDTIMGLSKVTVKGEIRDRNGNPLPDFNGVIYPTIYDKMTNITTLKNEGVDKETNTSCTFTSQKNTLFKGKASVTNGKFSLSFIVPKDIFIHFGKGRISYYAHNGYQDASGYFEDFIIGGTDTTAALDAVGPDIKLFMNDDKFVFGGTTNTDPKIYAVVSDSSGIYTAGISIGHDITAVLDGNNAQPIVLNDYYESDMDNYKKGTVRYPLTGLTEGNHTLTVKVWDAYGNSSSNYTEFVVAPSAQLALKHVLNYPNPFSSRTSFYFEHNKCCTTMDVQVQVFTISGKLVKTIHQQVNLEGFRSDPIEWNGTDDFGDKIGRGVYIYRLRARTPTGESAEQFEKLVILK